MITDPLRQAIIESGVSYKSLSRETGVARASIQRFVDGRNSLRLDKADALAAFCKLSLQVQKRKRSAGPTPRQDPDGTRNERVGRGGKMRLGKNRKGEP